MKQMRKALKRSKLFGRETGVWKSVGEGRPHILVDGMSILIRLKSLKQIQQDIQLKLRNSIKKLHNITP